MSLSESIREVWEEGNPKPSYDIDANKVREFISKLRKLSRKIKGVEGDWVNMDVVYEEAGDSLKGENNG